MKLQQAVWRWPRTLGKAATLAALRAACANPWQGPKAAECLVKARALFAEHCKTAGEKMHRTVDNVPTGFSGTLFQCIQDDPSTGAKAGDLVICFRSTEFIDDAVRDNEATNALEIKDFGFAFGQISDMEAWYQSLRDRHLLDSAEQISVTGYSGADNDTIAGGTGSDVYMFSAGWGSDLIVDNDGQGTINVADIGFIDGGGARKVAHGIWQTDDKRIGYTLVDAGGAQQDLVISFSDRTDTIRISNWSPDASLGISLDATLANPTRRNHTYIGDFQKQTAQSGTQYVIGPDGSYVATGVQDAAADLITATSNSDSIIGLGGNDALHGLAGDDYIDGGDGADILQGGLGADTLLGGTGNDLIYGDGPTLATPVFIEDQLPPHQVRPLAASFRSQCKQELTC